METPNELVAKAKPFFINYFSKLASDLHTLTAAPVTCTLGELLILTGKGELETLFEVDQSVAYVREDGTNSGDLHLIFDVATSIALTGMMMMMGDAVIREQVKSRQYTEEIKEGFQEVANQVVGAMNEMVERKIKPGGHLFLEGTRHVKYGDFPDTLKPNLFYLQVNVEIQVGSFPLNIAKWVLSKGFAEPLLGVTFPAPESSAAQGGAGAAAAAEAAARAKKTGPLGVDLSAYAALGDDPDGLGLPDLSKYANVGVDPDDFEGGLPDLSKYAGGDDPSKAKERLKYSASDGLPSPDEPGSVKVVTTETPFSLKEEEKVIKAINAMRRDGYRYIGVDSEDGKLVRIITESDLRQLMGPFFGTKAMTTRDKAICTVPLNKINKDQKLIRIVNTGTINQAADLINEFELKVLPVVSKVGVLRGFITVHAVMEYFRKKRQVG